MKSDVYIQDGNVYAGTRLLPIKEQRGRKYVHYAGNQINIKSIHIKVVEDPVYNYIFNGGFRTHPCPAMQYWIVRHRLKKKISIDQFKKEYAHCFKLFPPKKV